MQLINLMCMDSGNEQVYLSQFTSETRDTVESDLRNAVEDYLRTAEGCAMVMEHGEFTWHQARCNIPDDYWESQGFQVVDCGITVPITDIRDIVVDEDEDLAQKLLPQLQAEIEAAQSESDAKAIRSEEEFLRRLTAAGYTEEQGRTAAGLLSGQIDPESLSGVSSFIRECYNRPSEDEILRQALNDVLEMHGVENARTAGAAEPDLTYLEAGDTYNLTLVEYKGDWYCASLGDVIESVEGRRAIPGKLAIGAPEHDPLASTDSGDEPTLG